MGNTWFFYIYNWKQCYFFPALAGYNNLEVAEYLLQHGADVNAQDKGGLIPLHNAASYGVSSSQFPFQIHAAFQSGYQCHSSHGICCDLFHKELNKKLDNRSFSS